MFADMDWDICILFTTRAMSLEFDKLVSSFFPTFILFPSYTSGTTRGLLHPSTCSNAHLFILRSNR